MKLFRSFGVLTYLILLTPYPHCAAQQDFDYLPTSTTGQIITHEYYTLSYSEEHEQAEWVAYELTKTEVEGTYKRKDDFRTDFKITTLSAQLSDYKNSGYDKGHLAPAADMKFSEIALSESFFLSNISPQSHSFNAGIWSRLEKQVREWAIANGSIYVVTGGVLTSLIGTIGENVSVPEYYYKIILDYTEPEIKVIALLLPHENSQKPLSEFAVSIDSVETMTGIDFFPGLPDVVEIQIESGIEIQGWEFF